MVIYDKEWTGGLIEFGIEIPIMASRAAKAFEFFVNTPKFGSAHRSLVHFQN